MTTVPPAGETVRETHGREAIPISRARLSHFAFAAYAAFAAGAVLLLAAHHAEVTAAVLVWSTSTAFGHCFLVLPIAGWLAWERRDQILAAAPRPLPAAAILALPCVLVWLVADRLALMEGRQLALLGMVWVLALAVLGWQVFRAAAIPLGYLLFLVPFGAFLVPALQVFTAHFIDEGLELLAIPHFVDQTVIEIPEGRFQVAEACAGLRFLIAAIAFGVLYAVSIYRSPWRRLVFILASIAVPVIANGIRALGIVLLGHARGSAEAGAVDHVVYGWLFFSAVILLLVLLGLPFREDRDPEPALEPGPVRHAGVLGSRGRLLGALLLVLLLACGGQGLAWALDSRAEAELATLDAVDAGSTWQPPADCQVTREPHRFLCGNTTLAVRFRRFGPHATAALILTTLRAAEPIPGEDIDVAFQQIRQPRGVWLLATTPRPEAATGEAVCIDGHPTVPGWGLRVRRAWASFGGGADRLLAVTLAASGPGAEALVRRLVDRPDLAGCLAAAGP